MSFLTVASWLAKVISWHVTDYHYMESCWFCESRMETRGKLAVNES